MQIRYPKNMRAAVVTRFGGPEVLEITEIQTPMIMQEEMSGPQKDTNVHISLVASDLPES